jgi:hypothetical protein
MVPVSLTISLAVEGTASCPQDRGIYRQITNPRAAPNNSDLRQMRTTLVALLTTLWGGQKHQGGSCD